MNANTCFGQQPHDFLKGVDQGDETETDTGTETDIETEEESTRGQPKLSLAPIEADAASNVFKTLPLNFGSADGEALLNIQESLAQALIDMEEQLPTDMTANVVENYNDTRVPTELCKANFRESTDQEMLRSLNLTRVCIMADPFIKVAAEALHKDLDSRIIEFTPMIGGERGYRLEFALLENDLSDWLERHETLLGTTYIRETPHVYRKRYLRDAGYISLQPFHCHRAGNYKPQRLGDDEQQISGKRRRKVKKESIKVDCTSRISCRLQSKKMPHGPLISIYRVQYNIQHSHPLASSDSLGTQYLSKTARRRIKLLLQDGSPVCEVLHRLRVRADKFSQLGKTRIFCDDIITYEDVYNVFKQKRKDRTNTSREFIAKTKSPAYSETARNLQQDDVNAADDTSEDGGEWGIEAKKLLSTGALLEATTEERLVASVSCFKRRRQGTTD
ncbi:hypothetical protein BGZ98_009293 [Dissophora globulifera]|nr:hypothetical protein BGZ98_009293 [Dissophora globulifera]